MTFRRLHANALLALGAYLLSLLTLRPINLNAILALRTLGAILLSLLALRSLCPSLILLCFFDALLLPLGAIGPLRLSWTNDRQPGDRRGKDHFAPHSAFQSRKIQPLLLSETP